MNKQQAREILSVYRPGTADEHDPMFAEALELAHTDMELKAWFEESVTFDRGLRGALARVDAPIDLRDLILAEQKIIRPTPWWNYRLSGRQLAAAAAVVMVASLAALWFSHRPPGFADFRREIAPGDLLRDFGRGLERTDDAGRDVHADARAHGERHGQERQQPEQDRLPALGRLDREVLLHRVAAHH